MEPNESPEPANEPPRKVPPPPTPEDSPADNTAPVENSEVLSDRAAADFLGGPVRRLHQLRRRGEIAATRAGWRGWRFRSADLLAYVKREASSAATEAATEAATPPKSGDGVKTFQQAVADMKPPDEPEEQPVVEEKPVVRMANAILSTAIDNRGSDIYLEPDRRMVRVRVRIDGFLQELMALPKHIQAPINRYKVMADLDLLKRQIPQTGHIPIRHNNTNYDLRVTVLPTRFGETISIRVFDQAFYRSSLDFLGATPDIAESTSSVLGSAADSSSGGLFLVAGPMSAGLTTTAFCLLHRINSLRRKIITIEEVREYELPGITQTYINERQGATVVDLQRAALRQQADVLFMGDLRDSQTASLAVGAALSGVLTLATINANSAVDAVIRLRDLGVSADKISRALVGAVGQRLARCLCRECRTPVTMTPAQWAALGFSWAGDNGFTTAYRSTGCDVCRKNVVQGRIGLFELLQPNDEITKLIARSAGRDDLRDAAKAAGMRPMQTDALSKVLNGTVAPEEALCAVGRATVV